MTPVAKLIGIAYQFCTPEITETECCDGVEWSYPESASGYDHGTKSLLRLDADNGSILDSEYLDQKLRIGMTEV